MDFDFYYGLQSQTFSFYRIPKLLFTDSRFSSLSAEAKTLYGILLDRMDLSMKNGWLDKQNRVYLFFTVQEIQESLGCGKNKAIQLMKELEKMGLIERKRKGMGKPSVVYVKNILSCPESGLKRFRNQTSGGLENKLQEVGKANPNHTDYSQTDNSETNLSYPSNDVSDHKEADAIRKREDYRRYFREELGIDELKAEYPSNADMIDCSGFVCWIINNCGNGWSVGRTTADGLMAYCDIIPAEEAQPGDLIFFQGTYATAGASHVGIYVGGGMMIHCGNPISYASVETSYWQSHFYCYGRIR